MAQPKELVEQGVSFLSGLAQTLKSPEATAALVDSITEKNEKKRILIDIYQQNIGIFNKIAILFAQTTNYSYLCIVKRLIDCLG